MYRPRLSSGVAAIWLILPAALLILPTPATAQRLERTFDVAAGKRLDVHLETGGDLHITTWDRDQVAVVVNRDGPDADRIDVDFDERASGLFIRTEYSSRRRRNRGDVNMEITVPLRFDLNIETTGGDLHIDGVQGDIKGQSMGGDLTLSHLAGTLHMTTMGGDVELTSADVDGEVQTMGGDVLLEDVTGSVKGSTMGGEVTYRNVKTRAGGRPDDEVRISTMGGDINVDEAASGADVHTMGGDIRIRSAGHHVKAKTMGGEIDVDGVDGWIEATTMGGDIDVTMVGNPADGDRHVELTSMGGDVELTVPAGLSMAFDIELVYTRNADDTYRIISDFPMAQERTDRWDYHDGDARKYIYGTGEVAGGRHRIRIKTTNGNITVRRGR